MDVPFSAVHFLMLISVCIQAQVSAPFQLSGHKKKGEINFFLKIRKKFTNESLSIDYKGVKVLKNM